MNYLRDRPGHLDVDRRPSKGRLRGRVCNTSGIHDPRLQTSSFFLSSNFPLTYLGSGPMLQFSYSSPSLSHTHTHSRPQLNPTSPTAGSHGARVSLWPGWELLTVKHTCPRTPVSPRPAECLLHGEPSARTYRLEGWIHTLSAFGGCVPSTSFKTTKGRALVFLQSCFLDHFPPTKYF